MKKTLLLLISLPTLVLASINKIIVESGSDVVIKASKHDSWHSSNKSKAKFYHSPDTLVVRGELLGSNSSVLINLQAPLEYLEVRGGSNVILDHARTKNLVLNSSGTGTISLKGNLKLSRINKTGAGNIRGMWVNSDQLEIISAYGQIELAGSCKKLLLRGSEDAIINTQYLRCNNAWVSAKDYSSISLRPSASMKVWALDNSQVFYRKMLDYLDRDAKVFDQSLVMHVSK